MLAPAPSKTDFGTQLIHIKNNKLNDPFFDDFKIVLS